MGLFDRFRRTQATAFSSTADYHGSWQFTDEARAEILNMSPAAMVATQPYLRTVVTFMARNIAQLGVHAFERVSETDRRRVRDGGLVEALARPNRSTTGYELIYGLVADLALYDRAYWLLSEDPANRISRLPVDWVTPSGGDALGPDKYLVKASKTGQSVEIPADKVLDFHGWHPASLSAGMSPVAALKYILAEQVQAARYREQVWKRGGRVSAVISRPAGVTWSPEARDRFREDWRSKYAGNGSNAGGTPILEDGMTLQRVDFSAHDQQFIEGARLALNTVASVYHINPTMIGLLDNANYSNVREFRKMLYGDSLGPVIAQIEDRINGFLVPRLDTRPNLYAEFNIAEKLQGNFEEQAAAMQTAVGAPWMLRGEARALMNLPEIDGADELVTPLNVLIGGQASPRDSAPKTALEQTGPEPSALSTKAGGVKARPNETFEQKHTEVLAKFFRRQAAVIRSLLGAGAGDWWDAARWDKELAEDLLKLATMTSEATAKAVADELGLDSADYDTDRTVPFLTAVAERQAGAINTVTEQQVAAALDDEDPDAVAHVFDVAEESRAGKLATSLVTAAAGFAAREVAHQLMGEGTTKTWVAGSNPRPAHARMDGETVPAGEKFSNGADWPGDGVLDADDTAGCNCSLRINHP